MTTLPDLPEGVDLPRRDLPVRGARLPRRARRAQLLVAAHEVFVANGFHAAAMDEIAVRAGVSKPVLYQHFPSKLELYLALLDQSAQRLVQRLRDALESTDDNHQRVAATMQAYFDFVDDPAGSFRLLFESDLTNEAAVRERLDRMTRDCAKAISDVISEDTGRPHEEAMLLAVAMVGMAQVSARYWQSTEGSIPREHAAELVAFLSWRGIGAFPRRGEGTG